MMSTLCLGLQLSGNDAPFLVSSTVTLSCTSDLEPVIIEWLYSDIVVSNSSSSVAELTFDPVSDDLHGRVYICRVTSPYGVQLGSTTISVLGMRILHFSNLGQFTLHKGYR